jgi:hypothetical protein
VVCCAAFGHVGPYPRLHRGSGLFWILGKPVCRKDEDERKKTRNQAKTSFSRQEVAAAGGREREKKNALDARRPAAVVAQLEKARRVLYARRAQLALRVLHRRLGLRRGVHVLGDDGARQVAPQPTALVRLLLVLGRDPLGRDVAAVLMHVEQRALVAGL